MLSSHANAEEEEEEKEATTTPLRKWKDGERRRRRKGVGFTLGKNCNHGGETGDVAG